MAHGAWLFRTPGEVRGSATDAANQRQVTRLTLLRARDLSAESEKLLAALLALTQWHDRGRCRCQS